MPQVPPNAGWEDYLPWSFVAERKPEWSAKSVHTSRRTPPNFKQWHSLKPSKQATKPATSQTNLALPTLMQFDAAFRHLE